MTPALAAAAAAALALTAGPAQHSSFERVASCFQNLQAAAPVRMPPADEDIRRLIEMSTRCGWTMVLEKLTPAEARAVASLELRFEDAEGPAARVLGTTVHVSYDGIAQADQVGQVVGHDLFVYDGNTFNVPSRIAYGPLATQPIIGLTSRLSDWVDVGASATACQDIDCRTVQGLALFLGIDGFLLAHEAAHVIRGHTGTADPGQELEADRWAYGLLRRYDTDLDGTDTLRLARTAARLAPIVYFDYLHSRMATDQRIAGDLPELALIERRRQQLLELADKEDRSTLESLAPSVDTGVGRIAIATDPASAAATARFWIDGVPLAAADIVGRELTVVAGLRHVAARAGARFAYVSELVSAGERATVRLQFFAPEPSLPAGDLEQLAQRPWAPGEEKWLQVFLHTTDARGNPRSPEVALMHYQALALMGLGSLIPADPLEVSDARARRTIQRWRQRGLPLADWPSGGDARSRRPEEDIMEARHLVNTLALAGIVSSMAAGALAAEPQQPGTEQQATQQTSTLCKFTAGPRAGQTQDYAPMPAIPVGSPCQDGVSSTGIVIARGGEAKEDTDDEPQTSTLCRFTSGPRAGQTQDYAPRAAIRVGSPCQDGAGSQGSVVAPPSSRRTPRGAKPAVSTLCRFTAGPRAGETQDYAPMAAIPVGSPCQDGAGSTGTVVAPGGR